MTSVGTWSMWGPPLAWTIVTLGVSWAIGHIFGIALSARIERWLPDRHRALAGSAVEILRRRLPWWSLLVGVWLAPGHWPLTSEGRLLVERTVFVLGAASITLGAAAIASRSMST